MAAGGWRWQKMLMSGVGGQAAIKRRAAPRVTFCHIGRRMQKLFTLAERWLCAAALLVAFSIPARAQEPSQPPSLDERVAKVEGAVGEAALAGHNAWMLTSSALVLFMTAPGLAMFYSGLVREKNVLGVMMQCVFLMGLMTITWGLYGYSLAFGGAPPAADASDEEKAKNSYSPYIGNIDYLFMNNVQRKLKIEKKDNGEEVRTGPETPMEGAIPRLTHMLFQGMFFIITPA